MTANPQTNLSYKQQNTLRFENKKKKPKVASMIKKTIKHINQLIQNKKTPL